MLGSDSMFDVTLIKEIKDPFRPVETFNPGEVKVYLELIKDKNVNNDNSEIAEDIFNQLIDKKKKVLE